MSLVSRVSFIRRGFILAVLKDAGIRPKVREELIRVVRNGRMLLEMAWRSEEGSGSGGLHMQAGKALSKLFFAKDRLKYKALWLQCISDMHELKTGYPVTW